MVVSMCDVVACGDDPLLTDAVRVGGWLSVVCDTLLCGAGVARIDRGDTEVVALFVLCDDSCGGADHYPCWLVGR